MTSTIRKCRRTEPWRHLVSEQCIPIPQESRPGHPVPPPLSVRIRVKAQLTGKRLLMSGKKRNYSRTQPACLRRTPPPISLSLHLHRGAGAVPVAGQEHPRRRADQQRLGATDVPHLRPRWAVGRWAVRTVRPRDPGDHSVPAGIRMKGCTVVNTGKNLSTRWVALRIGLGSDFLIMASL